ncbi:MAG: nucleotide-diphospho-sugar transferase [Cytophagaceae bacterium]|jgi:hypothetical protein|nr:nucleotide-diphospho-sugar transferase [Cytophagaceae bacterium]
MNTPVLFIIFNRPDTTEKVFDEIRKIKPKYFYVAADGPRDNRHDDLVLCEKTRSIIEKIDWDCELKTLFRENNLGCRKAVSLAITWFFDNVEEGIILEDDCLPAQSFFGFCSMMLEKYRHDERIGHISGGNYQMGVSRGDGSYYFSWMTNVWGWASWRRIWKDFDVNIEKFPKFKELKYIERMASHAPFKNSWLHAFEVHHQGWDSWDYQYSFLNLINNRLSIIPNCNLVTNIGFDNEKAATHFRANHPLANIPLTEINLANIKKTQPTFIVGDIEADIHFQLIEQNYLKKNLLSRLNRNIRYAIKQAFRGELILH